MDKIMQEDNTQEDLEGKLAPPVVNKPEDAFHPIPHLTLASRASMDLQGDQATIQETLSEANTESNKNTENEDNKEDKIDFYLSFPRKLWLVAENQAFKSVTWNEEGDHVIIHAEQFQKEVLDLEGTDKVFHASTLKSFIRLLNLHEFTKIRPNNSTVQAQGNEKVMTYHNSNFRRDNPALVKNICMRRNRRYTDLQETHKTSPMKEGKEEAQMSSAQLDAQQELNQDLQMECMNDPGSRRDMPFYYCGFPLRNTYFQEPTDSSGEGTSSNNLFELLYDYENEGDDEQPSTSQSALEMQYITDLYICYSFLLGALLFPEEADDPLEGDKDQDDDE
ncbi:heat shock transcription factor, X-linked member 3-like [Perognathus longimembris pacificus]|uniref:heat shock transcription factor, X-linked member 3-like n=1 Tax=Perognathus longimembris pacificus TaxID=214514 RepID=UPI00201855DE|nr:heat shock transcription factor, X-linked member 3-like [Perognathus longimembris pacificus]